MRLRTRFQLLIGTSLLLGTAVALAAILTIRDLNAATDASGESRRLLRAARGMLVLTLEASRHGHERIATQWHARWKSLHEGLVKVRAGTDGPVAAPDLGDLLDDLPPLFDALMTTAEPADPVARDRGELLAGMLTAQTEDMIERVSRWNDAIDDWRVVSEKRLAWLVALGPVVMALPLVAMGWLLSRRVLLPVQRLRATMQRVEAGDLGARILATHDDELGDLKRAFVRMTESLQASTRRLAESEHGLRLITDHLPARVSHHDLDDRCTFANRPFCAAFGLSGPEAAVGRPAAELLPAPLLAALQPWIAAAKAGASQFFVVSVPLAGVTRHQEFAMVPDLAEDGRVQGLFVMARDVTDRVDSEARIEAALRQKETLLKEVHHRVKNNMQIISSLLQLQSGTIDDAAVRAMLMESQDRIRSMALIHEKLYQHDDFARIDFGDYVHGLLAVLSASHPRTVRMSVQAQSLWLGIDQAVPAGLVLNELVTNAFKHAFPNGRPGCITVQLRAEHGRHVVLRVADDGVGPPSGFSAEAAASLGLRLVRLLAEQLDAELAFEHGEGFGCRIAFDRKAMRPDAAAEERHHG